MYCCLPLMQPLTHIKFIIKHVTTALPRSHGTVSYERLYVEQRCCVFCNLIQNVVQLKSINRGRETWRASFCSCVNVTLQPLLLCIINSAFSVFFFLCVLKCVKSLPVGFCLLLVSESQNVNHCVRELYILSIAAAPIVSNNKQYNHKYEVRLNRVFCRYEQHTLCCTITMSLAVGMQITMLQI